MIILQKSCSSCMTFGDIFLGFPGMILHAAAIDISQKHYLLHLGRYVDWLYTFHLPECHQPSITL